ncbi:hypothetical protein N7481_006564 [Penicillium waksmanii]|uniref:uncharacterized protein n=1 Tax=Penicillium waksmanii TaxID=69791 RepID=UPI0025470146|nr:uncharacterized protein N7481_006564 [Penicillium waksmanii]KAJ5984465.1 hypothetical protein N7481_006564 [Penicillium waksmanii]
MELIHTKYLRTIDSQLNWKRVVRIFISSRPNPDIESLLERRADINIQANDSQGDHEKFLNTEVDKFTKTSPLLKRIKPKIIAKLLERCQGMFQWASLQVHQISRCKSPAAIGERLEKLPKTLQDAYDEDQEQSDRIITERALRWVMFASHPLDSVEILAAIRMDSNADLLPLDYTVDEQGLLSLCNNFLVLDSQLEVWRFPHLSVREYLESKEGWSTPHAYHYAASACLSYFVKMYEHDDSEFDAKLEAKLDIELKKAKHTDDTLGPKKPLQSDDGFHTSHPFHMYMRFCWSYHVNESKEIEITKLGSLLKAFLGPSSASSAQYQRWHKKLNSDHYETPSSCVPYMPHYVGGYFELSTQHGYLNLPLQAASSQGHKDIVEMFLDRGISIDAQGRQNDTALALVSFMVYEKIVKMLLDHGADTSIKGWWIGTALIGASAGGNETTVQMLLEHGADINAQGGRGGTALIAVLSKCSDGLVKMLLDRGIDPKLQGGVWGTSLNTALSRGSEKLAQRMLDRGVDINFPVESCTALILRLPGAIKRWWSDCSIKVPTRDKQTALKATEGKEKIVQMLLDHGATEMGIEEE